MQTYVAFISGLPIGQSAVKMETLRSLFTKLGFLEVETYLTTGNVIFRTAPVGVIGPLEAQISRHLRRHLDEKGIWTFIRTPEEIADIVSAVPFSREDIDAPGNSAFVVFLSEEPDEHAAKSIRIRHNDIDELHLAGREIYWLRRKHDQSTRPFPLMGVIEAHATVRSLRTLEHLAGKYVSPSGRSRR